LLQGEEAVGVPCLRVNPEGQRWNRAVVGAIKLAAQSWEKKLAKTVGKLKRPMAKGGEGPGGREKG